MRRKRRFVNKNSAPFLFLGIIHLGLFLILLKRKKQKNVWILLLSNIGFAYLFEYLTLNLFHGYKYKPSIMKKRVFDSILGAIFSQAIYVPISATFLTLLNKGWKWKINFSLCYYCIEKLFLRLNIYKVSWWKPIYTPIFLNGYFYISDWFNKALLSQKKWAMAIAHYLAIEVVWATFMYISAVKRSIHFGFGYFHSWNEHFKIFPFYSLILSFIAFFTSTKAGMFYRLLLPFFHIIIDMTLVKMDIFNVNMKKLLVTSSRYIPMTFISRFFYKTIFTKDCSKSVIQPEK